MYLIEGSSELYEWKAAEESPLNLSRFWENTDVVMSDVFHHGGREKRRTDQHRKIDTVLLIGTRREGGDAGRGKGEGINGNRGIGNVRN